MLECVPMDQYVALLEEIAEASRQFVYAPNARVSGQAVERLYRLFDELDAVRAHRRA